MNRKAFVNLLAVCGDAYVYYNSKVSNKQKYYVCTLDFKTEYVRNLYLAKYKKEPPTLSSVRKAKESSVLAFCWDLNDFKAIDCETVTAIEPLSDVLRNNF
jgi:hypothetical protein